MRFRRTRPRLSGRDIQLLVLIGIVSVGVLATLIGADIRLSRDLPGGGSFLAPWEGARAYLFRNAPPYGNGVVTAVQQQAYGRAARPGENPYIPAVPFFLLPAYFPLAVISDPATARGLWLFVGQAALVATALLGFSMVDWRPPRAFQIAFALVAVFGVYAVLAQLEGGPAPLLGLIYAASLLAYGRREDELAGSLLALTLFAWEIGALFVFFLLWKAVYDKRTRVLAGFGMAFLTLLVISLLIYPGWMLAYATASLAMLRWSFGTTMAQVLAHLSPAYGPRLAQVLTVALVLVTLYEWAATRNADERRFLWTGCLTLAITPLIGFRSEPGNFVVLLPAMAVIFAAVANRWWIGPWLSALLLIVSFALPWGAFLRWYWFGDARFYDYLMLFMPVFAVVGLYWSRWWFVRPPRTWYDHVRRTLGATETLTEPRRPMAGRS